MPSNGPGTLSCRAAMIAPTPLVRVMAYSLLYLVDLAGSVAAWCVTVADGEVDHDQPIVHWTGTGGGGADGKATIDGGDGLARALDSDDPVIVLDDITVGERSWRLPMSEQMHQHGYINRMLLVCRHEGRTVGVVGFLRRRGEGGFSSETAELIRIYGPVVGHTFSAVRETEHQLGARPKVPLATLSNRETEVAALAARGAPNAEIASTLGISTGTVKTHLHRVFEKLGVDTRTKLALLISADRARRPAEEPPSRDSP